MSKKEDIVGHTVGKHRAYNVVRDAGFWNTTYDVRDADTGKYITSSGSRATAMEKAEELAKNH